MDPEAGMATILEHLNMLCGGDAAQYNLLLDWLARVVQQPETVHAFLRRRRLGPWARAREKLRARAVALYWLGLTEQSTGWG